MGVAVTQTPTTNEVVLSWDAIDTNTYTDDVITNYRIYYGTNPVVTVDDYYENDVTVAATQTQNTFTDLEVGGTYYFSVTAVNSSGDESVTYSVEVSTTVADANPPARVPEVIPEPEPVIETAAPIAPVINTRIEPEIIPEPVPFAGPIVAPVIAPVVTPIIEEGTVQAAEPVAPIVIDTTPPLNPSNFLVDTSRVNRQQKVTLNWNKAIDIYDDIQDQVLYTRKGLGQWDSGYSIGADLESIEIDIEHNQNYEVKIVTVDTVGNESDGVTYIFSTHLAESGPNNWWSLVMAMMVFTGLLWTAMKTKQ
jgi:hypothetical protein